MFPWIRFRLYLYVLLFVGVAFAQNSEVRMGSLLLIHERVGWRVQFDQGVSGNYSLQQGDVLTAINGQDANGMGPLRLLAFFNSAFDRSVPVIVLRGGQQLVIALWRGDGAAPPPKPGLDRSYVSMSEIAPDFSLPTLKDKPIKLSDERGKWVLVSFWATWCTPCQQESRVLSHLVQAYSQELVVLALAVGDKREKIEAFTAKNNPAYTILDAGPLSKEPALSYGVGNPAAGGSVPVNVLVRPDGKIAYVQGGYEDPSPLESQIAGIMARTSEKGRSDTRRNYP